MRKYKDTNAIANLDMTEVKKYFGINLKRLFCKHEQYNTLDNDKMGYYIHWCETCGNYKLFTLNRNHRIII